LYAWALRHETGRRGEPERREPERSEPERSEPERRSWGLRGADQCLVTKH